MQELPLLEPSRHLVALLGTNSLQSALDSMIYKTNGKLQFTSQLAQWLAENPGEFAKVLQRYTTSISA